MDARKDLPPVLLIQDVARIMRCSTSTINRRLRARTFPVDPLPAIDKRKRWSITSFEQYFRGHDPRVASRRRK